MVIGIGIDSIEIVRFHNFIKRKNLQRIFSQQELTYCFSIPTKTSERLALRFAVKEAFYKAMQILFLQHNKKITFLKTCRAVSYTMNNHHIPELIVDWELLALKRPANLQIHVSGTHSMTIVTAVVIVEVVRSNACLKVY